MRKRIATAQCTREDFEERFRQEIHEGYPLLWELQRPADLEKGTVCGYIEDGRFVLFQDVGSRSLKPAVYEVLSGRFEQDGTVRYSFHKRALMTYITWFMTFVSVIIWLMTDDWVNASPPVYFTLVLVPVFILLYFIPSLKNRTVLRRTLENLLSSRPKVYKHRDY